MSNNVEIILYVGQSKIRKTDKTSHTVRRTVQGQTLSDCPLKSRLAGDDTANKKSGQSAVLSQISTNLANEIVAPGQSANVSQMATNSESEAGSVQPEKIVNNVSNKKIITNNIVFSEQSTNVHDSTTVNTFTSKKKLAPTTETVSEIPV
jgi:hypothetical protein